MSFHFSNQRPVDQRWSEVARLHSTGGSAHVFDSSVWSSWCCGPASCGIWGHLGKRYGVWGKRGSGWVGIWHSSRGRKLEFLLAPRSWEPSGRRRGVRSAVKIPTCLGTWKAWLTIPFEATGCKGAGHRQARTKMVLIVRRDPLSLLPSGKQGAGLEVTPALPNQSFATHWPYLINGIPTRHILYEDDMVRMTTILFFFLMGTPSLTQTTASSHKDQNGLLLFFSLSLSFAVEETASVSYTQI